MASSEDLELDDTLRVLAARAGRTPRGLAGRVFEASVTHLPNLEVVGRIGSRTSMQWKAAAAILIMVGGGILAWQTSSIRDCDSSDEPTLAAVIESSASASGDENFMGLASARGARFDDLAFEMRRVLSSGQAGR
ncbi:MAG: hypothetical protein K8R92_05935 [Planctomycetes bacterium]|nr:hypothetical protein [Planctomycetota bacterium]